jgi:hypothetical protein
MFALIGQFPEHTSKQVYISAGVLQLIPINPAEGPNRSQTI